MKRLFLGYDANGRGIHLDPKDRERHMHVIGSSGSGKSKFLEWMIRGDIKNRQGLCLIDPHGTLYEDIVRWASYHNYLDRDIILLNPSDGGYVTGFNPFARKDGDISVRVDYQIAATVRGWGKENTDETPTLERWLRCIYQTLNEREETIAATRYLINFFEPDVREYLTAGLSEDIIQSEWRSLASLKTPRQFSDEMMSTRNRLLRFLCSNQICRFMGRRENNINIREIMDEGKILLVNLAPSGDLSSENARLFGALLVNELFQEAKQRDRDEFGRPPDPFYLYIDEFQNFASESFSIFLSEARKFKVPLIMAHQALAQIPAELRSLILVNTGIQVYFRLNRQDSQLLAKEAFKYEGDDCLV